MRSFWSEAPLVRITLALIAGICIEIAADFTLHVSAIILYPAAAIFFLSLVGVFVLSVRQNLENAYRFKIAGGIAISTLLISFGYLLAWFNTERNYPVHFQNYLQPQSTVIATITRPPLTKEKTIRLVGTVTKVINGSNAIPVRGKLLINIPRTQESENVKYGDLLLFNSAIQPLEEPKNPEEFNYKRYQAYHNIYHSVYLKKGEWKIGAHEQGNKLMAGVYSLRTYFLSLISKYVKEKNDFAVASAIMLGYNDYLSGDITRAYATSGTLHVLSVSGLHVGIMFLMLNFVLQFMDKLGRRYQVSKAAIIILFIWFYACLTGLSPSVLRSAAMFSMIQLGLVLVRNVNMYNVIAGSALVLILFNPFIITEVGFCLSYIAVLGIVFLYPKIYALVTIGDGKKPKFNNERNWLLKPVVLFKHDLKWAGSYSIDFLWKIVAVSTAAQIATLPLSLFYFYQFPVLFLLSNLVVIPLSNLILFAGTALFIFSPVPYVGSAVGWVFNIMLVGLNKFIFFIDTVPFSLIQGISISATEMLLIYLAILLFCWLTEQPRVKVLLALLVIVSGLSAFYAGETVYESKQKKLVIYSVPKQSALAFIKGNQVWQGFDTALLNNTGTMLFSVRHHWWSCGIKKESVVTWQKTPVGNVAQFEGQKILAVDTGFAFADIEPLNRLKVDLIVVSHSPKIAVAQLQKAVVFDELIFDSSNKPRQLAKWKAECDELKIEYYDVGQQGAYLKDLNSKNL